MVVHVSKVSWVNVPPALDDDDIQRSFFFDSAVFSSSSAFLSCATYDSSTVLYSVTLTLQLTRCNAKKKEDFHHLFGPNICVYLLLTWHYHLQITRPGLLFTDRFD